MNINDKEVIKMIVSEVIEQKLTPFQKDLDDIKVKLGNHIEHFAYQFTEIKNDVGWLKKFFDPEGNMKRDASNTSDVEWLKWAIRFIIGGILAEAIAIGFHVLG